MRRHIGFLFLLMNATTFAQNDNGIAFQAVARNGQGVVMSNKKMQVRISILLDTVENTIYYQELKAVTTNQLGLFTVLIGAPEAMKIITIGDFQKIKWNEFAYFIRIEIDLENTLRFTRIGQEKIHYVAYAYSADRIKSTGIDGILSIQQGGTGFNNLTALKQALLIDKVSNTPDSIKILSKATTTALTTKLEKKDTISLSNRINQKINLGGITSVELKSSLGFLPFQVYFGQFFDTSRQIAINNTATVVKWSDTSNNNGVYISNNTSQASSRIVVQEAGIYLVQYALLTSNATIANDEISIWIRRNGSAYPNTLKQFLTGAIGSKNSCSGQAIVVLGDQDYIELYFSVKHSQTQLLKSVALTSPSRPGIPSASILLFKIQ